MLFSAPPPPPPPPTLGLSFKHKKHHKTSWVSCMTVIRVSSQSNVCKTNTTEDKAVKLFKHQERDIIWVSQMPIFFFIFFSWKSRGAGMASPNSSWCSFTGWKWCSPALAECGPVSNITTRQSVRGKATAALQQRVYSYVQKNEWTKFRYLHHHLARQLLGPPVER